MKFQDPSIWTNQDLMGAKGSTLPFSTGHRFPHLFGQWRPQTDGDRSHERFQEITEKTYQKTQPTKTSHKIPGSWQRPSCLLHFWLICWCTPQKSNIDTVPKMAIFQRSPPFPNHRRHTRIHGTILPLQLWWGFLHLFSKAHHFGYPAVGFRGCNPDAFFLL